MKNWNELSIRDKNDIIKVAVQNGITTLPEIRERYNEFAEGGPTISDEEYAAIMEKVAENNNPIWNKYREEEGGRPLTVDEEYLRILNDNSYNYRGYYDKYPKSRVNADTHWPDEFKTVYHPTFSDESIYSGVKSQYNPEGLVEGHWGGNTFIPASWQTNNDYSSGGKIHIKEKNRGKFTALKERTGHSASWFKAHGTPAQRKMATFALNARKWKHGDGGYLYDGESEDTQQMNVANSYPMSLQDYIAQRIQDTRDSAANVMNTREYPRVYFNSNPDYITKYIEDKKADIKRTENNIINEYKYLYKLGAAKKKDSDRYNLSHMYIESARDNIQNYNNDISLVQKYGKAPEGATCIFTVTDSYGNKRAVPGNMSWLAKGKSGRPIYEEKGFKLLKSAEPIQGDIIQMVKPVVSEGSTTLAPVHAYMYMGESEEEDKNYGEYLVKGSYSNGDFGKDAMRRNSPIWYNPSIDNLFRFVGNAADSARWTREYNELMQNGPLVEMAMGGKLNGK